MGVDNTFQPTPFNESHPLPDRHNTFHNMALKTTAVLIKAAESPQEIQTSWDDCMIDLWRLSTPKFLVLGNKSYENGTMLESHPRMDHSLRTISGHGMKWDGMMDEVWKWGVETSSIQLLVWLRSLCDGSKSPSHVLCSIFWVLSSSYLRNQHPYFESDLMDFTQHELLIVESGMQKVFGVCYLVSLP